MKTTVDRFGRVVVPKPMRTRLGLRAGTQVVIEEEEDHIVLRPAGDEPALTLKDGILIFTGAATGDLESAVTAVRDDRARRLAGMPPR
jgi:AbrB family looped-hinge helix DNA binding protein